MLVYANNFRFQGAGAEEAIFKAIGGWLKQQLGFGLHPDQLRKDGEFNGFRGEKRSWLRICATDEEEPVLYSWVLKNPDDNVRGRQWVTELGFKQTSESLTLSCVVKTEEQSILAARSPVTASVPRVIGYVVNNVRGAADALIIPSGGAVKVKTIGENLDSYRSLLQDIESPDRGYPLVLVSPTKEGEYLINAEFLQDKLVGLGQVVEVCVGFNSYDMADVIGQQRSAWNGAVNVLYTPLPTGVVRSKLFLSEEIVQWGDTQHDRGSHLLAWVTNNTNIPRLREHIRPEGVMQLALRRRMQAARAKSEQMDAVQLRVELENAAKQAADQTKFFDELVEENSQLEARISEVSTELEEVRTELGKKEYALQSLKSQLSRASEGRVDASSPAELLDWVCRDDAPLPLECLDLLERAHSDKCIVLKSARASAKEMSRFVEGRELLRLLKKLVTEYRTNLMIGGDSKARAVFGKSEYAAKESETVMSSKSLKRQRTFSYEDRDIEMFRHLKIGVEDDVTRTIRVHFHWDSEKEKIVIGYCGKHLPVSGQ